MVDLSDAQFRLLLQEIETMKSIGQKRMQNYHYVHVRLQPGMAGSSLLFQ
jgi:hypothetical protein